MTQRETGDVWEVVHVVDGDTVDVSRSAAGERVRLIGINAPERGECFYEEATAGLQALIPDTGVTLISDVSDVDRFGRSLRFVETPDGLDLGASLIEAGLARSQYSPPDTSRNVRYDELQSRAQRQQQGLWAPDACGDSRDLSAVQIAIDLQFDAPGNDNENLNEEWVRFTNDAPTAVDLSGWEVADESSSHRYAVTDLVLDPGDAFTLFTGCGADTASERYWCKSDSAVWNNTGDTVFLRDRAGNIIESYTYRG